MFYSRAPALPCLFQIHEDACPPFGVPGGELQSALLYGCQKAFQDDAAHLVDEGHVVGALFLGFLQASGGHFVPELLALCDPSLGLGPFTQVTQGYPVLLCQGPVAHLPCHVFRPYALPIPRCHD